MLTEAELSEGFTLNLEAGANLQWGSAAGDKLSTQIIVRNIKVLTCQCGALSAEVDGSWCRAHSALAELELGGAHLAIGDGDLDVIEVVQ